MKKKSKEQFLKELQGDNPVVRQRLYIPIKLWNEYLTYSKYMAGLEMGEEGGQVWKVMEKGLELIKLEEAKQKTEYDNRITILEDRIQQLEKSVYQDQENIRPKTMAD